MSRTGTINIRARDRALKRDLKRAEREVQHFGNKVKSTIGGSFKGGLATVGSFAAVGGLSSQLQDGMKYQTTLQRLGDQAKMSKSGIAGLDKEIRGHATTWGLTNNEMLEATGQLVNLQGWSEQVGMNMAFLGEAMTATGASAANASRVMSALMDQGVKTPEAMRGAFDALIEAGDAGNIPFDLMANNLSSILPMLSGLVSAGKQGHAEIGGLMQVLGKVTGGDISQVQTLTKALVNNLEQSKKKLRRKGYRDLFDKKGNLRNLYEIRERLKELGKDKRLTTELISSSEARSAIKAIGEYGDEWEKVAKAAAASHATHRKADSFMKSSAGRWRKALADIKNKFHEAMTPERIDKVADAAGYLVDVLGFASDHLGELIGAWAAWKGMGLSRYIGDVASSMQQLGGASATAGKALGVVSKAGLIGAVAGMSLAIYSYVDEVAGFSAKLGDLSQRILDKKEAQATGTRDWLEGVQSGDIAVDDGTRQIVKKRMAGEKLSQEEREHLFAASWGQYNEDSGTWEEQMDRLRRLDPDSVKRHNQRVDKENRQVQQRTRQLVASGSAVTTFREMAAREGGSVTGEMLRTYLREHGLDAQRRDHVRTGDTEADARVARVQAETERKLDAEIVAMLVQALEKANVRVTNEVKVTASMDPNKVVEELANSQAKNRSY